MSVHSNHYDNWEEYQADLAWEYRKDGPNDPIPREKFSCLECDSYNECLSLYRTGDGPMCEYGVNNLELFEEEEE